MPARASVDSSTAARAIPINLSPLISAYRKRGRFMLRVENLPQSARFSAGQNNGDGTWSLMLDELDELVYFAPKTASADHTLSIRLIAKDETEAFTIALIDFPIMGASDRDGAGFAKSSPASGSEASQEILRSEIHALEASLAAREAELNQLRASAERMGVLLQQKMDSAVADAAAVWKREEAARLEAEKARLEEQYERRLAERESRVQAIADIGREQQATSLRRLAQEFAGTKEMLAVREGELAASRTGLERLRKETEADVASVRAAAETRMADALKRAEAEWRAEAARSLGEMTARCEATEAALASARAVNPDAELQAEMNRLRTQLERLQRQADADIAAAKAAADAKAADALKNAETQWQARMAKTQAELTARWEAAEAALASARAVNPDAALQAEMNTLRAQLERLQRQADADIAAAKAAADARTADAVKNAETEWQARMAKAQAEMTARWEAAEAALASARLAAPDGNREAELQAEMNRLRAELERLQRQANADIAAAKAMADAKTADALKNAETEWQAHMAKALAGLTVRCEVAEAALASAREASARVDRDAEAARQERQRQQFEAEIQSVKVAAEIRAAAQIRMAESLRAAEAEWQARSGKALAEVTARCEAAEAALASALAVTPGIDREAEIDQLRAELERRGQAAEAELAAARAAAESEAREKLKTAQARWERETANALADAVARCETAEAALVSARRAATPSAEYDAYVQSLEREIKTLRATLVDREAAIVQAEAMREQMRLGTIRDTPAARWQPLSTRVGEARDEEPENARSNRQLFRDVVIVVLLAATTVLLFPRVEAMLPDNLREQIETVGGLFAPAETEAAPPPRPVAAASTQPKAEHPILYASRSINVRTEPSTGAAIAISLKRGAQVALLEKRGSWDRVEVTGPQNETRQGWVFNTYLSDTDPGPAAAAAPVPAKADAGPTAPTPATSPAAPAATEAAPAATAEAPSPTP